MRRCREGEDGGKGRGGGEREEKEVVVGEEVVEEAGQG